MEFVDKINEFAEIIKAQEQLKVLDITFLKDFVIVQLSKGLVALAEEYNIELSKESAWDDDNGFGYKVFGNLGNIQFEELEKYFYDEGGRNNMLAWNEEEYY